MARRHGSNGQVLIDPTGGATPVAVVGLNSWSLDASRDRADVTNFGDTNKVYVLGLPDYSGDLSGNADLADMTLFEIALGTTAVTLRLMPSTLDTGLYFQGLAYLDASITVSSGGGVTMSGSWAAAGSWALTQPA